MKQYLELMSRILKEGTFKEDRTGTGTLSLFGTSMRFNLQEGFPLLTTKQLHLNSIIHELLWFISGNTNVKYLQDNGVRIWNEWAGENGELGPIYGHQWRSWPDNKGGHIDQLQTVIKQLKETPDSRRIIVSAWNVADLDSMALPPCHLLFQFYSREATREERMNWVMSRLRADRFYYSGERKPDLNIIVNVHTGVMFWPSSDIDRALNKLGVPTRILSCQLYQRSADFFLGVPFNIASYSLLLSMVAQVCDMIPLEFIHIMGDTHLYLNHKEQAEFQIKRIPFTSKPLLFLDPEVENIEDFEYGDIKFIGYEAHKAIKGDVAI